MKEAKHIFVFIIGVVVGAFDFLFKQEIIYFEEEKRIQNLHINFTS